MCRLQKQTECYEEQFKTMNDEAVELKLKYIFSPSSWNKQTGF